MGILIRLAISAVALWITTLVIPGIDITTDNPATYAGTLVVVAALFGAVNAVLRPIIKIFGCWAYVLTLGLVSLVVNGALFLLTGWIANQFDLPFRIDGFFTAVLGALVVGVISWVLNLVVPDKDN